MEELLADLISLREAAALLSKSKVTVWRWVRSGKLPGVAISDRVFVSKAEVERIKNEQESQ